jgi:hypothetical protein
VADAKIDLTFTNAGARPGVVDSLRLRANYPRVPAPGAHEFFRLKYEGSRLSRASETAIGDGAPFIILPKESQAKRLVFSKRWEEPVISEDITLVLQVYSQQSRRWKDYESWETPIDESLWVYLANEKGDMTFPPESEPQMMVFGSVPDDLHEHTKPQKPLPDSTSLTEPSYFDYPRAPISRMRRFLKRK